MIPIEVSPEVLVALHRAARSPEESPDDVLRRLLDLAPAATPVASPRIAAASVSTVGRGPEPRHAWMLTPQKAFRPYIVASLQRHGGEAHLSHVLQDIEAEMGQLLTKADWETVDRGEIRWENAVRWERKDMADEGLIDRSAPKGYRRLTTR